MFTYFKSFGKNVSSRRRKTVLRARPTIEAMEERLVPTVSFKPVFNGETVYPFPPGYLKDGNIYPIYWGSWWQNNQAAENQLDFALYQIVEGYGKGFFRGLDQYAGGDASASYFARRTDTSAAPSTVFDNFPWGDPVMDEAHKLMNNGTVPNPGQTKPFPPIYVVITDPSVTMNGASGFNEPGSLNFDHWVVWVSTAFQPNSTTTLNQDVTTQVFSHELAEVITAPSTGTRIKPGSQFPANTTAGSAEDPGQIADNEPNNNYVYRIGGPSGQLVQAYWSSSNPDPGYYIVTDDNSYNMEIDPNPWTLNGNNLLAFSGGTLVVNTNQPGVPANQNISIDTVPMPTGTGVQVVMDGDSYDFESGQITSIQLDTANDTESIVVNSTLPNVPVTMTLGSGTYQIHVNNSQSSVSVNNNQGGNAVVQIDGASNGTIRVNNTNGGSLDVQLGAFAGTFSQIQDPVLVTGGSAATIEAYDQNNANDTSYSLDETQGSHLTVSGNSNFALSYTGVSTLSLSGGEGNDSYDLTRWQPGLYEQLMKITAGGAISLTGSSGRNTVLGPNMPTTWYLNTPSSGYATFAGTQRLTCSWAGTKSITIVGGSSARDLAGNTFYVEATGVPTSLYTGNGNDTVYVGGSGGVTTSPNQFALDSLDPIQATLYVDGQGGSNTLNLEDKAAATGENYTLDSSTLNRSGAAVITYVNIQTLTLQCGIHGNHIDVEGTHSATNTTINSGTGTNSVALAVAGENLDKVQGPLTLTDQGTDTLNVNDQLSAGGHTYGLTWSFPSVLLARTGAAVINYSESVAAVNLNGGGGTNTLSSATATSWTINATDAGQSGNIHFMAMQNLTEGAKPGLGRFNFVGTGNLTGSVNGGATATLDYSADGGDPIAVNLATGKASRMGGTFSGIAALVGSTATTDTLTAANIFNNWSVWGNSGYINGLNGFFFTGIENLVGGTGVDIFQVSSGTTFASINGGGAPAGQGDWLDYSVYSTAVTVNLATGSATGINGGAAGSVTNIQNVHGGSGVNTLTGDAQGNILIGGHGTITGGAGRSLLIGDSGSNMITGGSGGSAAGGDILIGGATVYDTDTNANLNALMAIFAEWQSADSYATRFSKINTGAIPGGYKLNYGTTVSGGSSTLTGATGGSAPAVDWFFAGSFDKIVPSGYELGEHVNNT